MLHFQVLKMKITNSTIFQLKKNQENYKCCRYFQRLSVREKLSVTKMIQT